MEEHEECNVALQRRMPVLIPALQHCRLVEELKEIAIVELIDGAIQRSWPGFHKHLQGHDRMDAVVVFVRLHCRDIVRRIWTLWEWSLIEKSCVDAMEALLAKHSCSVTAAISKIVDRVVAQFMSAQIAVAACFVEHHSRARPLQHLLQAGLCRSQFSWS